jgi:PAS domain S-box-containing protein
MRNITLLPWKHWAVAMRLTLATASVIVAAVAGLTAIAVAREEQSYRNEMRQQAELLLDALTASAADRLPHPETGLLSDLVSGFASHRTVTFARIYDATGRVIADARDPGLTASDRRDPIGQRLMTSAATLFEWQPQVLFAGRAVIVGSQRVGAIRVGMVTESLDEKIGALRLRGMAGAAVAATFGVLMALLVSRSITGPLRELTAATQRLAGGDPGGQTTTDGRDEIAVLSGAFSAMAARLRENIESLKEREAHYRLIIDHAGDMIYKADAMGYFTFFNPTAVRTLGYSPDELKERVYLDLVRPDFREAADRFYQTQLRQKTPRTYFEFPVVANDGREVWLGQNVELIMVDDRVIGFQAIARDITDRKYSEATLRESESRFRALIENSSDGIALMGPDGTILYEGPSTQHILGYTPEENIARRVFDLVHPDDRDEMRTRLEDLVQSGGVVTAEYRVKHKDGSWRWMEGTTTNLLSEPSVRALVANFRDITERRKAEEEIRALNTQLERRVVERTAALAEAKEEAERANRAKSEFLSRMNHELRTPLNAILGFGQLLEMDGPPPGQRKWIDQILKAGSHLLELINELLDIASIEAGRLRLSPKPVAVADVLEESLGLVRPLAAGRGIQLIVDPPVTQELCAVADQQRLKQVLLNLLSNAVKYNREGGSVTIVCTHTTANGGRVRLSVQDTGIGLTPEQLDKLFVPFERLGAGQMGVEGTGLGLALSKRLVEAMGGAIGVESKSGVGSSFWIDLPASTDRLEPVVARNGGPATPAPLRVSGRDLRVLYIEDNPSNLHLVESVLAHRPGVTLVPAELGRVGIDVARRDHPDLILLDLQLPDISGEDILRVLRADPATRNIPVVVISAVATPEQVKRLSAGGILAYFTKPLDIPRFLSLLDETAKERVT